MSKKEEFARELDELLKKYGAEKKVYICHNCQKEVPPPGPYKMYCWCEPCKAMTSATIADDLGECSASKSVKEDIPDWVVRLKLLAKSATPGPWHGGHGACIDKVAVNYRDVNGNMTPNSFTNIGGHAKIICKLNQTAWRGYVANDARFIAAANPQAILDLIDLLIKQKRPKDETK